MNDKKKQKKTILHTSNTDGLIDNKNINNRNSQKYKCCFSTIITFSQKYSRKLLRSLKTNEFTIIYGFVNRGVGRSS